MCNNSTAGPTGLTGGLSRILVTAGYDEATGLGSINVANLLTNWSSSTVGDYYHANRFAHIARECWNQRDPNRHREAGVASTKTPTGTVTFSTQLLAGWEQGRSIAQGVATFISTTLKGASYSITASYGGDTNFGGSTSSPLPYERAGLPDRGQSHDRHRNCPGAERDDDADHHAARRLQRDVKLQLHRAAFGSDLHFPHGLDKYRTLSITTTAPSSRLDQDPLRAPRRYLLCHAASRSSGTADAQREIASEDCAVCIC